MTNYEVDKTVRVTRNATGNVKRLNAAVVVNHRVTTAANGKTSSTPLSNDEVEKLTSLVQEAIGFSKDRGDSVKLINAPFKADAIPKAQDLPVWKQDWLIDLVRSGATPAALVLVALIILFGFVKPALKAAAPAAAAPAQGGKLNVVADDAVALPKRQPADARSAAHGRKSGQRAQRGQGEPGSGGEHRARLGEGGRRMSAAAMNEAGLENAAILLMSLGEEEAAEVFKHLEPKEVQRLGETIAKMKSISREKVESVLEQFSSVASEQSILVADTDAYVKNVLTRALGDDKAKLLTDRILQGNDAAGIDTLKWMDAGAVAELLHNEHPQIVAAILVHLDHDQAGPVLKGLPERMRNEVLIRIASLDGIQPNALRDLNEVMSKVLRSGGEMRRASLGGVKTAAEIINLLGSPIETSVLDFIREADAELAQKIMDNMFTFDDLNRFDDKGFQALLKEVQSESLVVALKGATAELRDKIFKNMSSRAAETLKRRPRIARPGAAVGSRGRAEGNAEDRAPPGRRRPDRARRRRRR